MQEGSGETDTLPESNVLFFFVTLVHRVESMSLQYDPSWELTQVTLGFK